MTIFTGSSMALCFLAAALLLHNQSNRSRNLWLSLYFFLSGLQYLYRSIILVLPDDLLLGLFSVIYPTSYLLGPIAYIYVLQVLNQPPSLTVRLTHFAPWLLIQMLIIVFTLLGETIWYTISEMGVALNNRYRWLNFLLVLSIIGYSTLGLWTVWKHSKLQMNIHSANPVIGLRWINLWLGSTIVGMIVSVFFVQHFVGELVGSRFNGVLIAHFLIFAQLAFVFFKGLTQEPIFIPSVQLPQDIRQKPQENLYDDEDTSRLRKFMQTDAAYTEPTLSLDQLADQLGWDAKKLSQLINREMNCNFFDYINGLRLERFKEEITKSPGRRPNILQIALDSGFNSKSAFYAFFKKAENMTPSEYLKTLDRL